MSIDEKLTSRQIDGLKDIWLGGSSFGFSNEIFDPSFLIRNCPQVLPFLEQLKSHDVIELGPGRNPIVAHFPCKSYLGVDAFQEPRKVNNGEIVQTDALSFLRRRPDSSAVIISFGLIDPDVLIDYWLPREVVSLSVRYFHELCEEVKRVLNPYAIIRGNRLISYLGLPDIPFFQGLDEPDYGGVYTKK